MFTDLHKQKLAIITTWYPPVNGIFIENYARDFALDYEVHVFVAYPSLQSRIVSAKESNVHVHRIYFPHLPRRTSYTLDFWVKTFSKKILSMSQDFDIIHAHNFYGGYVAEKVAQFIDKDFLVTLHSSTVLNSSLPDIQQKRLRKTLRRAAKVICVGQVLKSVVKEKYGVCSSIVPNYVDADRFIIKDKNQHPFRFVMIGHSGENKGAGLVIQAFNSLLLKEIELHLIGDIKGELPYPKVILHGNITNIEAAKIISDSHVLISFSKYETFGVSVLEGMSCGLPIIYTKSGGPEYLVPDYGGMHVERNTHALVSAMNSIYEDYNEYSPRKIRNHVRENYSKEVIRLKMCDIYNNFASWLPFLVFVLLKFSH